MERIPEGNIPEKQIRRSDVSVMLLEIQGSVPYKIDLESITKDSSSVPRRKRRGVVADALSKRGFRDINELDSRKTTKDIALLYLDMCLEKRSRNQKIKAKDKEGYLQK